MGRIIKVDEALLNQEFEDLLDEMYFMYHYHQTSIPHYSISDSDRMDIRYYDALGSNLAEEIEPNQPKKRKKVRFHNDPNYCNGLPRRK